MSGFRALNKRPRGLQDEDSEDHDDAATDGSSSGLSEIDDLFSDSEETGPNPRTIGLRRPTTADPSDFWYVSQKAWDEYLAKSRSRDKFTVNNAVRALNKYNRAGKLMETDEGVQAGTPCYWCARPGQEKVCVVGAEGGTCAYCYRLARAHCSAKLSPEASTPRASSSRASLSEASTSQASTPRASTSRTSASTVSASRAATSRATPYRTRKSTATTRSTPKSPTASSRTPVFEGSLEQRPVGRLTAIEDSATASANELRVLRGDLANAQAQLATALTRIETLERAQQSCVTRTDELVRTLFGDVAAL